MIYNDKTVKEIINKQWRAIILNDLKENENWFAFKLNRLQLILKLLQ